MNPIDWFYIWTTGSITGSLTIDLDWQKNYLVTGGLVQTDGGDYSHAFISEVCQYNGSDVVACGIRDDGDDSGLNLYEFISGASSVTIALHSTGGRHRVEGSIYEL